MDHGGGREGGIGGFLRGRTGLALLGFLALGAFFLLAEHRAHLLGVLPLLLLLLLCPLLHAFMHGGHDGAGDHAGSAAGRPGGTTAGPQPHRR